MSKTPKVFVIYYSMYGHVEKLARQALHGLEKAGASGKLYQFPETLSPELLKKLHAAPRPADVSVIKPEELSQADGFLFGMPTRFGNNCLTLRLHNLNIFIFLSLTHTHTHLGIPEIDVDQFRANVAYSNISPTENLITWFWLCVTEMRLYIFLYLF